MSPPPSSPHSVRRVVIAGFIGTTIEWYDFFLYGTASALVFNKLFFPQFDSFAGTMAAFATNAVGFFARPLGGMVFGHFGDKLGRKSMLVMSGICPRRSSPRERGRRLLCPKRSSAIVAVRSSPLGMA